MEASATSKISEKDSAGEEIGKQRNAELHIELQKIKRSEEVMRNFAKALLSTLKQYKCKLKESENEVQYLKESLRKQRAQSNKLEKELNEITTLRACPSKPAVEECANALSFNHGVSLSPIPSDPDNEQGTDVLPDETNTTLSPETSAKIEMDQDTKTVDGSLLDTKSTDDKGELSLPLHQRTLQKESENEVRYLKESLRKQGAQSSKLEKELNEITTLRSCPNPDNEQGTDVLPDETNTTLSPETSVKIEMDQDTKTVDGSLIDTKSTDDKGELSLPLHQRTLQKVDISAEACSRLPLEENAMDLNYQYLYEDPENFQKLAQRYVQVGEMDDVVMNLSEVSSLKGRQGNAPVNIPLTEHEYSGETSTHSACVTRPTVLLESEDCTLCLPVKEDISINQDGKGQSLEKVKLTENVRSSTTHSTEALKSEEDGTALRPLNCQRLKRKLLPASAIHFEDFSGLFMDENAAEVKRKKTGNLKARSDGSISLIRILKSNLPR